MPDTIIQTAKDFWAIIGSVLAFVIWQVRLESVAKSNSREIARLEKEMERDRQDNRAMLKEIREDIKTLLQRRAGE